MYATDGERIEDDESDTDDEVTGADDDADNADDGNNDSPPDPRPNDAESANAPGGGGDDPDSEAPSLGCGDVSLPQDGLRVHLDSEMGVQADGESVTSWENLGSDGGSFSPNGGAPSLVEGAANGLPAVRFDGSGQGLAMDVPINGAEELTFVLVTATTREWYPGDDWCQGEAGFVLYEQGCSGTFNTPIIWAETGEWGFTYLGPGQQWISYRFGTGGRAYSSDFNDPFIVENRYDPRMVYHREASIGDAWTRTASVKYPTSFAVLVEGEVVYENSLPEGTGPIANTQNTLIMGSGGHDRPWGGDMASLLIYDRALAEDELTAVDTYLACRFFDG